DDVEKKIIGSEFGTIVREQHHRIYATAILATHVHVVFGPLGENLDTVIARLKRRTAAAVLKRRREMPATADPAKMAGLYRRPILSRRAPRSLWSAGKFPVFIFDEQHLFNAIEYVRDHNRRVGSAADPFDWIEPLYPAGARAGERLSRGEGAML
ncbi:MAG TPA: hypothetical protein VFW73_04230, partial [Lacipirellulaceae bacterium]|nr:hypothetical protein [Lacipirellulaceae bacterium]